MKLLVCGTRNKAYYTRVWNTLDSYKNAVDNLEIIEGCCENSADAYAEEWCRERMVLNHHFPSVKGKFLERDRLMVEKCDEVCAFWDSVSRGTGYTIAYGQKLGKPVKIIDISRGVL